MAHHAISGVEFVIEDQRIFALEDSIGAEQARVKAEELKGQAFGALSKLMILSRKDDTVLRYMEKRYEPFWHLQYRTHLEYERQRKYAVDVKPAVRSVVLDGREYRPDGGRLHLDGCEFCVEDLATEAFVDAVTGKRAAYDRHVTLPRREIAETEELGDGDVIVVPAKVKASSLTRSIVAEMLHPVEADSITVEEIRVQALHLYFRPVYAFEYAWPSKQKTAVLELDAATREVRHGGVTLRQKMQEVFSEHDLFDIGADVIDLLVPGGGIALKLAKKVSDRK